MIEIPKVLFANKLEIQLYLGFFVVVNYFETIKL